MPCRWHLAIYGDDFCCHNWGKGALYWHLVNRGQRCGSVSLKAQDRPSQESNLQHKMSQCWGWKPWYKSVMMEQVSLYLSLYIWEECNLKKVTSQEETKLRFKSREPESKTPLLLTNSFPLTGPTSIPLFS